MSLEEALAANTAAVLALTAALSGKLPDKTGAEPAKPAKAATKPAATKETAPAAQAAAVAAKVDAQPETPAVNISALGAELTKLADFIVDGSDVGRQKAVGILSEFGAKKMSEIDAKRLPEFQGKVRKAIADLEAGAGSSTSLV